MAPPRDGSYSHDYNQQGYNSHKTLSGEEIVITGIAGLFPNSGNVSEFMDNLYNKVDMVIPAFENLKHPDAPKHLGKISGGDKFDAQFFRVTYNQAATLDSISRKSMENAYAAIFDAGENPLTYKGRKIGVYTGSEYSDSGSLTYSETTKNNFVISGNSKCMIANRISYFLDSNAPSVSKNCGSASSIICLEDAFNDIRTGICEAALVGGSQICIHHILSMNLKKAGLLSLDGKTKCFDKNADGYVRSEAVSFLFLQKAKHAKRIYAEIYHIKSAYGLKNEEKLLPIRKQEHIANLLESFYSEAGVSPKEVEYVEANGAALPEGDINELEAINEVFANDREVMVGCVKSNMGNSEAASGVCGITKLCLAYHKGQLPANLHYNKPLEISSIQDGKIKILRENTPFNRGFTAFNTFAYTGMDCHALLKGHYKPKNVNRYDCNIPRLVIVSGRQNEGVEKIFKILKSQLIDPELIGLLHNIYQVDTPGHTCRGYTILDTDDNMKTVSLSDSVQLYQGARRPLCFVFSGMGSQWPGMGTELLRIPIFAAAIEKCRKVLEPKGIDIIRVITEPDGTIFDKIMHCFVGIAAVQIGLIDILKAIDLVPDCLIGHSVGEMACAYFDGCLTAEEIILAAYYRGLVSMETKFIKGAMAAVGLGYKDALQMIPPSIDIACRNSAESCTISGPASAVKEFVLDLKSKDIFAKEIPSTGIAYHSRYIQEAGPIFLKYLKQFTNKPVLRSEKWISTSVPPEKWNEPSAKYSSPEYHANNLLNPVYFEEAAMLIPSDAVIVEIAPHSLLQAILKRSHPKCLYIPLTKRGYSDSVIFLLKNLGNLYTEGFNPKINMLYPKIEFPVSTETPIISPFIEWYHHENWPTFELDEEKNIVTPKRRCIISIEDDDYAFIAGHVINGDILFPEAAVLFLVWETFAMYKGVHHEDLSVAFRDVHYHEKIVIEPKKVTKLNILITKGKQHFEVTRDDNIVVSGNIEILDKFYHIKYDKGPSKGNEDIKMSTEDIYNIFRAKGFHYKNEFQSIKISSNKWNTAEIKWTGNWITFLDSLIQLNILARNHDNISSIKLIKYMNINVNDHICKRNAHDGHLFVQHDIYNGLTRCDGVEIRHIVFDDLLEQNTELSILQTQTFIPHCAFSQVNLIEALHMNLQLVAENSHETVINVMEIGEATKLEINKFIQSISQFTPEVTFKFHISEAKDKKQTLKVNLFVVKNFLTDNAVNRDIHADVENNTFILSFEEDNGFGIKDNPLFTVITSVIVERHTLILLKKNNFINDSNICFIPVTYDKNFSWVSRMQCELQVMRKVILVSEIEYLNGIFGLVKKLKKDFHDRIGVIVVEDNQAPKWDPENNIYKKQIEKNLVFNVLKKGKWGSYYYMPFYSRTIGTLETDFNLVSSVPGDIDSLKWAESDFERNYDNNMVQVCFAGPSLRDTERAVGFEETNTKGFGMDFSGFDSHGNKVMGLVNAGAMSKALKPNIDLLWPVPENWSLEEAATVPLPYIQALYCLTIKGQLLSSHSVFVNGGTGALGQAVISICLGIGCNVYTSVGDINKKHFLMKLFPQLSDNHIGYSYDGSFFTTVIYNSKNKCDFVINCMTGREREFAMNCVGAFGIFFDLSTHDIKQNTDFGMFYLEDERSYAVVNLSTIFNPENAHERKALQRCLSEGIANGIVRPLTYVVFSSEEVPRAFRLLTSRKHRGRVLINIRKHTEKLCIVPTMKISSEVKYVVVCDETQFGVELANWLVKRGAKQITLHMKHKKSKGYLDLMVAKWQKLKVCVSISTDNLNSQKNCMKFLTDKNFCGQLHGIFIIQGCSKAENCSQKDFVDNCNDLIAVATNLNIVSMNNYSELRYFVIISRTSENPVDEYTTSVLEQICRDRAETNLPSLLFRTVLSDEDQLAMSNVVKPQTITEALNALETSLNQKLNSSLAYNIKKHASQDYIMKLMKTMGIKDFNNIDETLPLNRFLSNEVVFEEIKHVIKVNTGLELTTKEIKHITINRLQHLGAVNFTSNTKIESGMGAFYKFIDQDEMTASEVLIPMPTLSESTEDEQYLDADGTYLMLLPGFEGHHHIFKYICERLKIGAVALQLRPNVCDNSIQGTAADIKKHIMKTFSMKSKFYLLGYSYGVNVALEVAALFEKDGLTGVVYCLYSSPDALRVQLDAYLGNPSENLLQNSILTHLCNIMSGQTSEQLSQELENINDWSKKINVSIKYLNKRASYTFEYCKDVLEAAYKRITLAQNYKPNLRLESELVLLKGIPHPKAERLSSDYNLSKYTKKDVKVFEISSDVATATEDCKVANIVNRLLDPGLLEEFKRKNLCESYLT